MKTLLTIIMLLFVFNGHTQTDKKTERIEMIKKIIKDKQYEILKGKSRRSIDYEYNKITNC